nr:unnamed protein product [Spirometra erinaceieuropaei]
MSSSPTESSRFNLSPVGTLEQLDALTNALSEETYRRQLVTYLSTLGGDTVVPFVDRVFGALFSEDITSFVTFLWATTRKEAVLRNASVQSGSKGLRPLESRTALRPSPVGEGNKKRLQEGV